MRRAILSVLCATAAIADFAHAQFNLPQARPCRGDQFYVDVPLSAPMPWWNTAFLAPVAADLEAGANALGQPWFCSAPCSIGLVTVTIESVLPERMHSYREDGHLRFFRIRFQNNAGNILSTRPEAACAIVSRIRALIGLHAGAAPETYYVGRECDATAMSAEGAPSTQMSTWHLPKLGLPASAASVVAPPPAAQTVDFALIDSGVLPSVSHAIGIVADLDLLPERPGDHPHGTGMAILARQAAPSARMFSTRVLEASGTGTSDTIAQAIDHAIHDAADPSRPLVINLSLAWPKELDRAAILTSGSCATHEDPFGEAVRYVLDVARRLDDTGEHRIFVAAAAGNQPYATPASLFPPPPSSWVAPCAPESISGSPWLYPAHWARRDTCRYGEPDSTRIAFGAGVVDDRDLASGVSIPNAESPLVTPGQHVYAAHRAAPATPVETSAQCSAPPAFPAPITMPRTFSGTSVAAAFVSAAAARAQSARIAAGADPFDRDTLARLLYLTGRRLCRATPDGTPVRRLDLERLDRALGSSRCSQLIRCATTSASPEVIASNLLDSCKLELAACGLETVSTSGAIVSSCPRGAAAVGWPSTYHSPVCAVRTGATLFSDAAACAGTCPFAGGSDRVLLGSLGPEPSGPACPDCPVLISQIARSWTLTAELERDYPAGTYFSDPYLILEGPDAANIPRTRYLSLTSISSPGEWRPGAFLELIGTLDGLPSFDWPRTKVTLSMTISANGASAVKDVSPLRLIEE